MATLDNRTPDFTHTMHANYFVRGQITARLLTYAHIGPEPRRGHVTFRNCTQLQNLTVRETPRVVSAPGDPICRCTVCIRPCERYATLLLYCSGNVRLKSSCVLTRASLSPSLKSNDRAPVLPLWLPAYLPAASGWQATGALRA